MECMIILMLSVTESKVSSEKEDPPSRLGDRKVSGYSKGVSIHVFPHVNFMCNIGFMTSFFDLSFVTNISNFVFTSAKYS